MRVCVCVCVCVGLIQEEAEAGKSPTFREGYLLISVKRKGHVLYLSIVFPAVSLREETPAC